MRKAWIAIAVIAVLTMSALALTTSSYTQEPYWKPIIADSSVIMSDNTITTLMFHQPPNTVTFCGNNNKATVVMEFADTLRITTAYPPDESAKIILDAMKTLYIDMCGNGHRE